MRGVTTATSTRCDGVLAAATTGITPSAVAMHNGQWKSSPASKGAPGCWNPDCVQMNDATCGVPGFAAETSGHSAPKATANAATILAWVNAFIADLGTGDWVVPSIADQAEPDNSPFFQLVTGVRGDVKLGTVRRRQGRVG